MIESSMTIIDQYNPAPAKRGRPPIEDGRPFKDITQAEQLERWQRVRHVLRKLTPHQIDKHFDMRDWLQQTSCGTVGCAAGQCSLDPWFTRRGFGAQWHSNGAFDRFTIDPERFFGRRGYSEVFVNMNSMEYVRGDNIPVSRKPRAQHRITLRNVNQYIKRLKPQADL